MKTFSKPWVTVSGVVLHEDKRIVAGATDVRNRSLLRELTLCIRVPELWMCVCWEKHPMDEALDDPLRGHHLHPQGVGPLQVSWMAGAVCHQVGHF